MKNKHGYDHSAAIQLNNEAAYRLGFADGRQGADCYPEGSELYREGWQHGREWLHIEMCDEGYWVARLDPRALADWPKYYLTDCPDFVRGWHTGATDRHHQLATGQQPAHLPPVLLQPAGAGFVVSEKPKRREPHK